MHNSPSVAALPQLDRGSDYESERHRFESYTPHQLKLKASGNGGFSFMGALRRFEPRSRRGRQENAERFLRAGESAGRRAKPVRIRASGCAESYTPHQLKLKASGNGGFSFMPPLYGIEPRSKGPFLIDSCKISCMRLGEPVMRSFFRRPIRVIFRGRASDIQAQVSRSQQALSGHARAACGTLVWRGLEALWRGPA